MDTYNRNTGDTVAKLLRDYEKTHQAIAVNFRELVNWIPYQADRASHLLHPYPAKLLPHIPYFLLQNELLAKKDDLVVDPFSGSGSVLVEAMLSGRNSVGADCNPMARLISRVKTTPLLENTITKKLGVLKRRYNQIGPQESPDVVNINHWFYPHVINQLSKLRVIVLAISDRTLREFFLVCFSCCVRRVSLADPCVSVPVRLKLEQYPKGHSRRDGIARRLRALKAVDVFKLFEEIVTTNAGRVCALGCAVQGVDSTITCTDARVLGSELKANNRSAGIVITSPPYAGAQKYVRAMSLSMGWLGMCRSDKLRCYEMQTIGREHYPKSEYVDRPLTEITHADAILDRLYDSYPLRGYIAANYLIEMRESIRSIYQSLRDKGSFVLVSANNEVCGTEFMTSDYLKQIAIETGFTIRLELIDDIKSRGLMTKRNKTASMISREMIAVFSK